MFLENPLVRYWRFEVVFSFVSETSSSALNFVVNQSPSNGSCSISPLQGTTSTLFTVACPGWFDEDGIKDYTLSSYTGVAEEQTMLAFSSVSDFTIRLPSSDSNQTQLNLLVTVRDTLDCVVSVNLSSVNVVVDVSSISQLVDQLSTSTGALTTNTFSRLLSSGNQNTVAQLVGSLSQYFNKIDSQSIGDAVSSKPNSSTALTLMKRELVHVDGVPIASISVSSLASPTYPQVSYPLSPNSISASFPLSTIGRCTAE